MSQNRKRKSEGERSEGRKKTERASWIVFVLLEKQRYDLFSWGLVLFLTFASQNRIRQAKIRKEYQWSKLHDYLYSYLYLRRTRRQSPSVDPHSFPLVLLSPQPSSLPYRDSWQIDWRFLIATWNGIIKRVSFHCTLRARFVLDCRAELKNSSDYFGSLRITGWRDTAPDTHRSEFLRACDARCKICHNDNEKDLGHGPVFKNRNGSLFIDCFSYLPFLFPQRHAPCR